MLSLPDDHGEIDEIHELNRLFLSYLKKRLEARGDAFELSAPTRRALGAASGEILDRAAQFPRALFRLHFESWAPWQLGDPIPATLDSAQQALQLTLLLSAWNLCRRSTYAARLFLGLSDAEVGQLCVTPLGDLHRLAIGRGVLGCAFADTDWLWPELLAEAPSEHRRQLSLIALQPNVAAARPR